MNFENALAGYEMTASNVIIYNGLRNSLGNITSGRVVS